MSGPNDILRNIDKRVKALSESHPAVVKAQVDAAKSQEELLNLKKKEIKKKLKDRTSGNIDAAQGDAVDNNSIIKRLDDKLKLL